MLRCPVLHATETARPEIAPRPRSVQHKQWVPSVSLALGSFDERLRLRVDGSDYESYRGQLRTFLALGLAHPVLRFTNERLWIDGHAAFGAGPTFYTGHWHLPVREDVSLAFAASHWLTLRGGLGVGVTIDATASDRSFAELALPIGLTFFRTIELIYRPMLSVPLGTESSPVFGGERELATRLAVLPFELSLRYRIQALGW
jgi:hypothetical protein